MRIIPLAASKGLPLIPRMPTETPSGHAPRDPAYGRSILLVMAAGSFWSLGGILVRLVEAAGPWQILLVRSVTLSITLFIVLLFRHRSALLNEVRGIGLDGVAGALCLGVAFTGFMFALIHTSVANAVFMLSAAPFLVAPLAWLLLGERVRRATWIAMVFAVAGVAVMVAGGISAGALFGNLAAISAVFGFAGFALTLRRKRQTDTLTLVCLAGIFTAVVAAMLVDNFTYSLYDFGLCTVMGVIQMGVGMAFFTLGSRHVPAAELTLLSLTEVVLGPIWVWLWIGETPRLWTLLGGAVVMAALIGHGLSGMRRKPPPLGAV